MGITNSTPQPKFGEEKKVEDKQVIKKNFRALERYKKELENSLKGNYEDIRKIFKLIRLIEDNSMILAAFENYYKPHAAAGNEYAQTIYGWCLEHKKNYDEACMWYKLSVEQDNSWGIYSLSVLYYNGFVQVEDPKNKAYELALKCSQKGNHFGSFTVGLHYFNGEAVEQDYKKAFDFFSEAVEHVYFGYTILGEMYLSGKGTTQDTKKAQYYFNKAIETNDPWGAFASATLYYHGNEDIPKDPIKAMEYCLNYDYPEELHQDVFELIQLIVEDCKESKEKYQLVLKCFFERKKK